MMEIRLLKKGFKNNEQFYKGFLEDKEKYNDDYFSDKTMTISEILGFPICMREGSKIY